MDEKNFRIYDGALNSDFPSLSTDFSLFDDLPAASYAVFPGFCDVHVHFREPGFCYKEDMLSGSMAAAKGGFTAVCPMPNLDPVPDSLAALAVEEAAIRDKAVISVYPYGAITKGEKGETLADMEELAPRVVAFSDDGKGVQNEKIMLEAFERAKKLNKIIVAHCEVNSLLRGGYIHDGVYAREHGHKGICSASEYEEIERDVWLARKTGAKFHVCHVSAKESVDIIRKAKRDGADVTCETAPHYLILDDSDLREDGRFKMNPPLRDKSDKTALIEGILDGTIDMIATDHAPHSKEEKSKGLEKSNFGIVGLETAFPLIYTHLVRKNIISLEQAIRLMAISPRKRFSLPYDGYSVWNLDEEYAIDEDFFLSKGKSSPFVGTTVFGKNYLTVSAGKVVYKD